MTTDTHRNIESYQCLTVLLPI